MKPRSKLTNDLITTLRQTNGPISYTALEGAVGLPLDSFRLNLATARRRLEADEGIVFETIRGEGLRRMSDSDIVKSATKFRHKIRRTAIGGTNRLSAVSDPGALSNAEQLTATLHRTVFEAVQRQAAFAKD